MSREKMILSIASVAMLSFIFFIVGFSSGIGYGRGKGAGSFLPGETYIVKWMEVAPDSLTNVTVYHMITEHVDRTSIVINGATTQFTGGLEYHEIEQKDFIRSLATTSFIFPGVPANDPTRAAMPIQQ